MKRESVRETEREREREKREYLFEECLGRSSILVILQDYSKN